MGKKYNGSPGSGVKGKIIIYNHWQSGPTTYSKTYDIIGYDTYANATVGTCWRIKISPTGKVTAKGTKFRPVPHKKIIFLLII